MFSIKLFYNTVLRSILVVEMHCLYVVGVTVSVMMVISQSPLICLESPIIVISLYL